MTISLHPNKPLVLVVDDDLVIQMQLRHAMQKEGYKVVEASDGKEALDIYNHLHPDIVLLDAMMPVMDGFTCCAQLQALAKDKFRDEFSDIIPILMITGLNDPDSVDKAYAVGASDYITKPIHWAVLRQRVRRLLQMSWAMKELRHKIEQEKLIVTITHKIRQSLNLEIILKTTVTEVRKLLQADRVIVYRFQADGSGTVLVESVGSQWEPALGKEVTDCYFVEKCGKDYKKGNVYVINNIYTADIPQCQIDLLAQLQAQANLVVPIVQDKNLWGLLVAYQCSGPREWQQLDIDLLTQLADQLVIAIQQAHIYQQLEAANQELKRLANIDSLTQIANRRCFDEVLFQEWKRLKREKLPLSLILCDIDFFKNYNDTYGHPAGDECLKQVAKIISQAIQRPADLLARYGGEEFVLILPYTDTEGAIHIAQSIRYQITNMAIPHVSSQVSQYVTLSLGIATLIPDSQCSPQCLISQADQALYQAKQAGRNCYAIASSN
ncbi:diguanylate cyclase [Sphaerospermopsis aphanizomenoides BCCUSP55]|uniref:diguanylate cyclase domain-containing protein n=1 Tax=Sphaerospermopsis aphanizomenoides TaxID=459663 RepID=UPI001903C590|nr:diguanylate cyclase [Sphaerospermopsis aphanizomenoides]MBK1988654.1 diguanylate cyclase [Sphaerospermopsis aphanizomenoides BCCUSP55]